MIEYTFESGIATIRMDDGKANAVSSGFVTEMNACLDRAEQDKARAVILAGRAGMFSAGFDLKELARGGDTQVSLISGGFDLLIRLVGIERPLIAACDGHGIGMGAFLLMACDTRICARGAYKFSLPETAIGMDLNPLLCAVAQARITPRYLTRTAIQSENLNPDLAVEAGLLDAVVDADALCPQVAALAAQLAQLPDAYGRNKRMVRAATLDVMREYMAQLAKSQVRLETA